jgi:uncharacterized protein with GYD domain
MVALLRCLGEYDFVVVADHPNEDFARALGLREVMTLVITSRMILVGESSGRARRGGRE